MTYKEIKIAIIRELKDSYPELKIYGIAQVKDYIKPCMFVTLIPIMQEKNLNYKHCFCTIEILKVQTSPNEEDALNFFDTMAEKFSPKISVGKRKLNTSDFNSGYQGSDNDIPYIEFDIEYYENIVKKEEHELMKEIKIKEGY